MRAEDIGYMLFGAGLVLLFRTILAWDEAKTAAREAQERLKEVIPQPNPEEGLHYLEREARRVERPLEERSVPGVVLVRSQDVDLGVAIASAEPGSITYLRGARAE